MNAQFEYKGKAVEILKIRRWKPWTFAINGKLDINRYATEKLAEQEAKQLIDAEEAK